MLEGSGHNFNYARAYCEKEKIHFFAFFFLLS